MTITRIAIIAARVALIGFASLAFAGVARAQSAGTLRGAVVDNCGRAVAGAELRLLDVQRGATSAESGRFALAGLPSGTHRAELVADGFAAQTIRFEISSGRMTDLGSIVVGTANEGSCNYVGLYRDVATIRTISTDRPDDDNVRSLSFRVTKECPGGCE